MNPFGSADEMLTAHELMFGPAGRTAAELVLKWSRRLFAVPLDPLTVRVVLAPVEIGPYNKHTGYHFGDGCSAFILGNRHHCEFRNGERNYPPPCCCEKLGQVSYIAECRNFESNGGSELVR
jgi:hypothetical protein